MKTNTTVTEVSIWAIQSDIGEWDCHVTSWLIGFPYYELVRNPQQPKQYNSMKILDTLQPKKIRAGERR